MAEAVLRCSAVVKRYPGVVALDGVDLDVHAGTVHAIAGENGAGKSTLMKILAGAVQPDHGTLHIAGERRELRDAAAARSAGIAIVYQEFSLAPDLDVGENIFLGQWPRRPLGRIDFAQLHRRSAALIEKLGIRLSSRTAVRELSVAQQQMVEIARALALDARVLILDEPSAVLTTHELNTLFALIRDLRRRGLAILYISHRLEEIFELADTVTVLRDGRRILTQPVGTVTRPALVTAMVGRALEEEFPPRRVTPGATVLRVEQLSCGRRFKDISFTVAAGEVFALTGLVGSGRSSVLQALFGAIPVTAGTLQVGTVRGPFRTPRAAMAAGIGSLPEDRKHDGLLLERPLRENITLASLDRHARWGVISGGDERSAVRALMDDLRIKAVGTETAVNTLSGGNQQKALIARWMGRAQRVLLFDEPTRGVDVGAKVEIYSLINRLAADGVAIVMVSSELPEVIGMADRIGVMQDGRLVDILDNRARTVRQEHIMQLAAGPRSPA